jgi:hypothetical protein
LQIIIDDLFLMKIYFKLKFFNFGSWYWRFAFLLILEGGVNVWLAVQRELLTSLLKLGFAVLDRHCLMFPAFSPLSLRRNHHFCPKNWRNYYFWVLLFRWLYHSWHSHSLWLRRNSLMMRLYLLQTCRDDSELINVSLPRSVLNTFCQNLCLVVKYVELLRLFQIKFRHNFRHSSNLLNWLFDLELFKRFFRNIINF